MVELSSMDYSEPSGTQIQASVNLTDLDLAKYSDYDLFESFSGMHVGKFHKTDIYTFFHQSIG